ncbi:uncharacterized protein LOC115928578 [Strongylocentrotus purpuratus]|uniref:Reverse transcriptase domain-containing protein n=1 Tax=Strongylocentrotus purpuratus TaxID=7668 RepID=A0A7M7PHF5_STRPU|nr:uncharacterized protein LOC115928578 [Strongylocentrotus purpuratus]
MPNRAASQSNSAEGPLSRPALTVLSWNAEGISDAKEEVLAHMCKQMNCDVLCLQETHRGSDNPRPKIKGMKLAIERPHRQYGSAIFMNEKIRPDSTSYTHNNDIEVLNVTIKGLTISSIYKPPNISFSYPSTTTNRHIVIGDYNSHSTQWGYDTTGDDGALVETWAQNNDLKLIHDPKLPKSFTSARWKRRYNPDLVFCSRLLAPTSRKFVAEPIPRSQHRPIGIQLTAVITPNKTPFKRRFNFAKADWPAFTEHLDHALTHLPADPKNYESFIDIVKKVSRTHIPRGCRTTYIPGIDEESSQLLANYTTAYDTDAFSEDTINLGEELISRISQRHRQMWQHMIETTDLRHSSRKAWATIRKLGIDSTRAQQHYNVTADEVANQLLKNGKAPKTTNSHRHKLPGVDQNMSLFTRPISEEELQKGISTLHVNKAAGIDDIRSEQIKHMGSVAQKWLLDMFNNCIENTCVPKQWLRTKVVAILKPGKDSNEAKNFRPISLLCQTYKLLERLILNRIGPHVDSQLNCEQAGFRPGKSTTGQLLNLTQHIEDGFQNNLITGAVFVDLSAAYDTVNHRRLQTKLHDITNDLKLTRFIQKMMQNRRFFVELDGQKSRWRKQKNGLPQGGVLAPTLYNIYTADIPSTENTRNFIYADDTCITAQHSTFEAVELHLNTALASLSEYYRANYLRANPSKTQVCVFHLKNREAKRELKLKWNNVQLNHCEHPVYLGVKLDRTLSFKKHIEKTIGKVESRNAIIGKLVSSHYGADPKTVQSAAVALCMSSAEYACPVWSRSAHVKKLDTTLNNTYRKITGCLKPTKVEEIYHLAGIGSPNQRRTNTCLKERMKQATDDRHMLHGYLQPHKRLISRHSFLDSVPPPEQNPPPSVKPVLIKGLNLKWPEWQCLNRMRTRMGRCKVNMARWGYAHEGDTLCDCGETQTMDHLLH